MPSLTRSASLLTLVVILAGCGEVKLAQKAYHRYEDDQQQEQWDKDHPLPDYGDQSDHGPITYEPGGQSPAEPDQPQRGISDRHRLVVNDQQIAHTQDLIHHDPVAKRWFELLIARCDKLVNAAPLEPGSHAQMLATSRQALQQITNLAGGYRLTNDKRYADRAIQDMQVCASLRDWNPTDFLATAEMTNALAIGYDWLYDQMDPQTRAQVKDAIIHKGLQPALQAYSSGAGWTVARHNWSVVCNGGAIVGALAVMNDDPRTARAVLAKARLSIRYGMSCFAPDGAWEEGVTYWNYATRYAAFAMSSLQNATGDDWGLSRTPGLEKAGLFRMYAVGPTGLPFNFADSENEIGNSAQMMYFAKIYHHPEFAAYEQASFDNEPAVFDLLWYEPTSPEVFNKLSLKQSFGGLNMVSMRGSWTDPNATWIAMKGGSNEAHHGHLDLGTFVLDALGTRFVSSLGADSYDLPEYFGARRFNYYRCSTRGQNTITLDKENQDEHAQARILGEASQGNRPAAVLDLSQGYVQLARKVERGVSMINRRQIMLQDELDLPSATDIAWTFHTQADVSGRGNELTLNRDGKTMMVRLLSPADAHFDVQPLRLPPPQKPAEGFSVVSVRVPNARGKIRIAVLFSPNGAESQEMQMAPLDRWIAPASR